MNVNDINVLVANIAIEYGYPIPEVKLNRRLTRKNGRCFYKKNLIELSTSFVELNEVKDISGLIKHELAHFKYPDHGDNFAQEVLRMGADKIWTTAKIKAEHLRFNRKYKYVCPNGHIHYISRKLKRVASCSFCDPIFNLKFVIKPMGKKYEKKQSGNS